MQNDPNTSRKKKKINKRKTKGTKIMKQNKESENINKTM